MTEMTIHHVLGSKDEQFLVALAVIRIRDGANALMAPADSPEAIAVRQRHVDYNEGAADALVQVLAELTGRTHAEAQEVVARAVEFYEGLPEGELSVNQAAQRAVSE